MTTLGDASTGQGFQPLNPDHLTRVLEMLPNFDDSEIQGWYLCGAAKPQRHERCRLYLYFLEQFFKGDNVNSFSQFESQQMHLMK